MAFHTFSTVLALASIKVGAVVFALLFPNAPELLFGKVPASFMLDAMDVSVFLVLLCKLTAELWDSLT